MWKRLWKLILIIIIIIIAIYFPAILLMLSEFVVTLGGPALGAAMAATIASIPWWVGAMVGVGLAYVIDPGTTKELAKDVGDAAGAIGGAVGDIVGKTASSFLSGAGPIVLAIGAAWLLLRKDKSKEETPEVRKVQQDEQPARL